MTNPSTEEKRKSKSRFSLKKKLSSTRKKNKNRSSNINKTTNGGNGEGSAEFGCSSGSFHEPSEELTNQAQHDELQSSDETEDKPDTQKRDRRKSNLKNKALLGNAGNAGNPKKTASSDNNNNNSNNSKRPNKKKSAVPNNKVPSGHAQVPVQSNVPASAYGLNKQINGKNVQYTVNEKGESVQFSVNKKGVPELWLQVDHDQCLVSPMTIASASSSSLSTTQQSLDSQPMSSSKQDLFMKTSLLTIGEGGKPKENGVRPKVNSLMGERTSENIEDDGEDDDSIAAEEQLLNQFDDTYKKAAAELPKPRAKNKKVAGKKKKKKEKDKKKRSKATESGDEDDRKTQPQSNSAMPSAKIPSLEERSSIKLPPAKNGGKSVKKIKRKSEKARVKDMKAIAEDEPTKDMKAIVEEPISPPPAPPRPQTTPPSAGGGRRVSRRIQRINSTPASTFSSLDTSSPEPKDSKARASVMLSPIRQGSLSKSTRSSTYESPRRMNLKDLRKRFGSQQSEISLSLSPAARAAGSYGEVPSELQAYGRPTDQRSKRPGLKRKEYRMSQRSLRNLEPESSVSDDDQDDNLVEYLKSSNYKLDL
ncbi:unnamed protein product [Cylindrotheca closterium]|uniref:Uncharacterized protein n=1 Tax=Cylindrotheca closterium TaxID=2856 RepID=A0AAD2CJD4_9STRA|nr:unnamed protein product [Cylindrotheca closterium]